MTAKEMARRLAALEEADNRRRDRARGRVLDQMSPAQVATFSTYVDRWVADNDAAPTSDEWDVLNLVNALLLADPETQPGDYVVLRQEEAA